MEALLTAVDGSRTAVDELVWHLRDVGFDDDLSRSPSLLPGWSNGHVLTHVARNADGMRRMLTAAQQGEVVDMYASAEQREREIDQGAHRPVAALLADLLRSESELQREWERFRESAATRLGRRWGSQPWPLADFAFIRWREVVLHSSDLSTGRKPDEVWPARYVDLEVLRQVGGAAGRLPAKTAVVIDPIDRPWDTVLFSDDDHAGDPQQPLEVKGSAAEVLAWFVGRRTHPGWPPLTTWAGVP